MDKVTYKGKSLEKEKTDRVTVLDKYSFFAPLAKAADARQGEKAFARGKRIVRKDWLDYFNKGKPLLEPTPYVEIIEN